MLQIGLQGGNGRGVIVVDVVLVLLLEGQGNAGRRGTRTR